MGASTVHYMCACTLVMKMKVGDLVRCLFQPRASWDEKTQTAGDMEYQIQNELGIIINDHERVGNLKLVLFPQFGYTQPIAISALEMICEGQID